MPAIETQNKLEEKNTKQAISILVTDTMQSNSAYREPHN